MSASHIISLVLILASIVITALNIALIWRLKRHSKSKPNVKPEIDKETEQKLDQAFMVVNSHISIAYRLARIAEEISTAAEDYRIWILNTIIENSHSIENYNQGKELHRKLRTFIKKYNMLTEEAVQNG